MFTRRSLLVVIALIAFSAIGRAQNSETVIPLEGLDPVMLSQGKEVQGDMKYKVTRGKFQYIFANAENKAAFEKTMSGNSFAQIGKVTKEPSIIINGSKRNEIVNIKLDNATDAYRETFKDY